MEKPIIFGKDREKTEKFRELLNDKYFKFRTIFLSGVIEKINIVNMQFQDQTLEFDQLYFLMKKIIRDIAELVIKAAKVPEDLTLLYFKLGEQ